MEKYKVLMLIYDLRAANGVASFAINYFRNLDHQKVQMDFALYSDTPSPYYEEIKQAGGNIFVLPTVKNLAKHLHACETILRQGHYDIIHDNSMHITIPMMMCAMYYHVPVRILHSHNSKSGETRIKEIRNKTFLPFLLFPATDYLACSQLAGNMLFGSRPYTIVPNVISSKIFQFSKEKRNEIRMKMDVESKCVVGSVGRLAIQKNPFFAMDIFQAFLSIEPKAEYWWVGDGPLYEEVKQYIHKKGLERSVRLLGSRTDVADLYQAMDVFLFPSKFEGLGITGIEAQAAGLPMVVSDVIPNEMYYTNLVDHLSLNETAENWAKHLKMAALKSGDRKQYARVLENSCYSDTGCGERLMKIYEQLLEKRLQ